MSSGVVKKNVNSIPKSELPIQIFFDLQQNEAQKLKFRFISKLISLMRGQKIFDGYFKILSNLISLTLNAPEKVFDDVLFSESNENFNQKAEKEEFLVLLDQVRIIFNKCPNLTIQQKLKYCSIERYFMKCFLKRCSH